MEEISKKHMSNFHSSTSSSSNLIFEIPSHTEVYESDRPITQSSESKAKILQPSESTSFNLNRNNIQNFHTETEKDENLNKNLNSSSSTLNFISIGSSTQNPNGFNRFQFSITRNLSKSGLEEKENYSFSKSFQSSEFHTSNLGTPSESNSLRSIPRTEMQSYNSAPIQNYAQVFSSQNRNAIIVSKRQQGNPVLKFIRNIRWVFSDIVPDYYLGNNTCALFLSLRYHLLHPDYLYFRIRELKNAFRLRVLICYVDIQDVIKPLHEVTKTALLHDVTLICAWSLQECARYLETFKSYENKPADLIQERTENDYLSKLTNCLTVVSHVNKTDVLTLGNNFSTLSSIFQASTDELSRCPGIGEKKLKRLHDAFHLPFKRNSKQLRLDSDQFFSKSKSKSNLSQIENPSANEKVEMNEKSLTEIPTIFLNEGEEKQKKSFRV